VLPLGGDGEQRWPKGLRIFLYLLGLGWCFMGVAIVSDVFMGAIECITSKKKRKLNPKTNRLVTVPVWNPTVANLTLMALGSSAPEILLSVIELFGNSFFSGDLGPSTIVGSAAFNLLIIVAVCVSSIPTPEVRYIKETPVYMLTSTFSILAYLWLLVILLAISPNVVEIWEGVFTFLYFPLLVGLAYLADQGYFSGRATEGEGERLDTVLGEGITKDELAQLESNIRKDHEGQNLSEDQMMKLIEIEHGEHTSRAAYRVAATRAIIGGKRVKTSHSVFFRGKLARGVSAIARKVSHGNMLTKVVPVEGGEQSESVADLSNSQAEVCTIEFNAMKCAVLENAGSVSITVVRRGITNTSASVGFRTREGTAKAESDYTHMEGRLQFAEGQKKAVITVNIVDDLAYEEDEEFFVDLFDAKVEDPFGTAVVGINSTVTVVIIDDDLPGVLSFPEEQVHVPESLMDNVTFVVQRKHGSTGKVTCMYHTEDATAIAGVDYEPLQGKLEFDSGETQEMIKGVIKVRGRYESSESFRLILTECTGGAKFDPDTDGGPDSCILTVIIESEPIAKQRVDRLMSTFQTNWKKAKIGHSNWREQFTEAIYVNGGDEDGTASIQDWAMHAITLPWKLLFALCPPTDFCGGWLCFCASLLMIGLVTAIIGDMASLLGCVAGVPDEVTAITFVALGTSLPDTFASKTAATQDPYADASVGNVTGSNSVNVFLGLGLPWMIGAAYWAAQAAGEGMNSEWIRRYANDADIPERFRGGAFIVKAGNLAFSVIVFSCCAFVCIVLLIARRRWCGGELGGEARSKYATSAFLVFLWLLYVALSAWYSIR